MKCDNHLVNYNLPLIRFFVLLVTNDDFCYSLIFVFFVFLYSDESKIVLHVHCTSVGKYVNIHRFSICVYDD